MSSGLGRRFWIALVTVLGTSGMLAYLAGAAGAATTSYDRTKTILFDGRPTFPLVLSPGPPLGGTTPWGADGLAETASAGVNMYRTGAGGIWDCLHADDSAAAAAANAVRQDPQSSWEKQAA